MPGGPPQPTCRPKTAPEPSCSHGDAVGYSSPAPNVREGAGGDPAGHLIRRRRWHRPGPSWRGSGPQSRADATTPRRYAGRVWTRSCYPSARPATGRRASGSGRSASPGLCKADPSEFGHRSGEQFQTPIAWGYSPFSACAPPPTIVSISGAVTASLAIALGIEPSATARCATDPTIA